MTRGDIALGRFSVFHYRNEQLVGVDSVNQPMEHILARKLLAAGVSPSAAQVSDMGFELKSLL